MDNLEPETYDAIVSNVMEKYDQEIYQAGYIDGLQTAIRVLAEQSETMSYSIDIDDMFHDDEDTVQEYNEITGKLYFKNSHMYELLDLGRSKLDVDVETLMMVDSIDMSDTERNYIVQKCIDESSQQIVITHGTDTMCDTAKLLGEASIDKTIILFGSMVPYAVNNSDALFNFGCALGSLQLLECGVYVAMNGRVLPWTNVEKNRSRGVFQALNS